MRFLTHVTLSLFAGLVISVLVAWAIAAWGQVGPTSSGYTRSSAEEWTIPIRVPVPFGGPDVWIQQRGPLTRLQLLYRAPAHEHMGTMIYLKLVGFPCHCLASTSEDIVAVGPDGFVTDETWRSGLTLPTRLQVGPHERRLPLIPLPFGLALNSIVFGIFAYFFPWLWFTLLAPFRRHKGMCIRCRYPLIAQATCPECGTRQRRGPPA